MGIDGVNNNNNNNQFDPIKRQPGDLPEQELFDILNNPEVLAAYGLATTNAGIPGGGDLPPESMMMYGLAVQDTNPEGGLANRFFEFLKKQFPNIF